MKLLNLQNNNILNFKFKKLKSGNIFLSNDFGKWVILSEMNFNKFIQNKKLPANIKEELISKKFMIEKKLTEFDYKIMAGMWIKRHEYLLHGPSLHIIVLTKNCNYNCIYCHASASNNKKFHLSKENAKKYVDIIFQTSSGVIDIEFQGGEPLLNRDIIKFIVEYAQQKNKVRKAKLGFSLVSNLSLLTDEIIDYSIKNDISISTSIDGPKEVHDYNRRIIGGKSSFDLTVKNFKKLKAAYKKAKIERFPGAVSTATKKSLKYYKQIVDTYVKLGIKGVFIRPLNPIGYAKDLRDEISYSTKDYLIFHRKLREYINKLKKKGVDISEAYSNGIYKHNLFMASRINFMEERVPCGAGIGQLAYDWNGKIYTCDEGRMIGANGDDSFMLGDVNGNDDDSQKIYQNIINNIVTKIMIYASYSEGIPGYNTHPYIHYTGLCPIYSYSIANNIISKYKNETRFNIQEGMLDDFIEGKNKIKF